MKRRSRLRRFLLKTQAASGAYTLSCAAGTYTYTGQDATLLTGRVLVAAAGAYAYAGQNATLTKATPGAYSLVADAGAYSYAGQSATLTVARALSASTGSYAYAGQAATLAFATVAPTVANVAAGGPDARRYAVELDVEREQVEQEDHHAARKKAIEKQRPKGVEPDSTVVQEPKTQAPKAQPALHDAKQRLAAAKQAPLQTGDALAEDVAKLRAVLEIAVGALTDQAEALEAQLKQQQRRRTAFALILAAAA